MILKVTTRMWRLLLLIFNLIYCRPFSICKFKLILFIFVLLLSNSKVWNTPLYEKESSEENNHALTFETPKFDDRTPLSVKVINSTRFRGPPQYNVSSHQNISHLNFQIYIKNYYTKHIKVKNKNTTSEK